LLGGSHRRWARNERRGRGDQGLFRGCRWRPRLAGRSRQPRSTGHAA